MQSSNRIFWRSTYHGEIRSASSFDYERRYDQVNRFYRELASIFVDDKARPVVDWTRGYLAY